MKALIIISISAVLFTQTGCFAQDAAYEDAIEDMAGHIEKLESYLKSGAIDFNLYDRWYKEFKEINKEFKGDFSKKHNTARSYKSVRKVSEDLALAWSILHRSQDAEKEYADAITSEDVQYAHKWKNEAAQHTKDATDVLRRAIEEFKTAEVSAGNRD